MKDKEKQIEERLEMLHDWSYGCYKHIDKQILVEKLEKGGFVEINRLFDKGYRKLNKDSVVLTKTEKEKLLKGMYEQGKFDAIADLEKDGKVVLTMEEYEYLKNNQMPLSPIVLTEKQYLELNHKAYFSSKETAEKIFNQIIWYAVKRIGQTSNDSYYQISFERLNELAKQFGVEIKE